MSQTRVGRFVALSIALMSVLGAGVARAQSDASVQTEWMNSVRPDSVRIHVPSPLEPFRVVHIVAPPEIRQFMFSTAPPWIDTDRSAWLPRYPLMADPRRWPRLFANTTECTLSLNPITRRHWWQG
jgi:hypothetical protein